MWAGDLQEKIADASHGTSSSPRRGRDTKHDVLQNGVQEMNLLEIVILQIFLLLFSMPSKPTTGDKVDANRMETCGVEHSVEGISNTRGLHLEEESPVIDSSAGAKAQSNAETAVSRPVISSSKPKINKRIKLLPKPPNIVIPRQSI